MAFSLLLTGLSLVRGEYVLPEETDLCSGRPNTFPNGEHLEAVGSQLRVYVNWTIPADSPFIKLCLMRFTTCTSCLLHVISEAQFNYRPCPYSLALNQFKGWCAPGCAYIHIYDKDYINQTAKTYSSSSSLDNNGNLAILDVQSMSKTLYVIACSNQSEEQSVSIRLKLTAEEKVQEFREAQPHQTSIFTSPFFPDTYTLNSEIFKFIFQALTQDDFVTISFDDWQLSPTSSITFENANIIGPISGSAVRPWVVSDRARLQMTFDTGMNTVVQYRGFKATYNFYKKADRTSMIEEVTNCGISFIQNSESGIITFNPTASNKFYDCIWVINRHSTYKKIAVKIINYSVTKLNTDQSSPRNRLHMREELTSLGILVEDMGPSIRGDTSDDQRVYTEHVADDGFYVRLRGTYSGQKDFVLSYTSFIFYDYNLCLNLFSCKNARCIPPGLTCNKYDNCGDNSDEDFCDPSSNLPPTGYSSSPIGIGIIIPIVVSVFLIVVICLLIVFIRRCRRLSHQSGASDRHPRRLHINTVSGEVSRHGPRRHRRRGDPQRQDGEWVSRDLPPSYEDVLNNTPIGYLNLGYVDNSYSSSSNPIQPPSYDEAMSPTPTTLDTVFDIDSSDSSSPFINGDHSLRSLSTTYSSDSSQIISNGRSPHQRRRRDRSSDSSDSSNDERPSGRQENGCEGNREGTVSWQSGEGQPSSQQNSDTGHTNIRHSIVKPEDTMIEAPAPSSEELAQKNAKSRAGKVRKKKIVLAPNHTGETAQQDSPTCIVEESPVISAPPATQNSSPPQRQPEDAPRPIEQQAAPPSDECRRQDGEPDASPTRKKRHNRGDTARHKSPPDGHKRSSPSRGRTESQVSSPDRNRRIPSRIQKAKNAASHGAAPCQKKLMKQLSRSVGDLRNNSRNNTRDEEQSPCQLPPRQFSKSVQNLFEDSSRESLKEGNSCRTGFPDRGFYHHQSQQLSPTSSGSDQQTRREAPRRELSGALGRPLSERDLYSQRCQLSGYQYDSAPPLTTSPAERSHDVDWQVSWHRGNHNVQVDDRRTGDHSRKERQRLDHDHRERKSVEMSENNTDGQESGEGDPRAIRRTDQSHSDCKPLSTNGSDQSNPEQHRSGHNGAPRQRNVRSPDRNGPPSYQDGGHWPQQHMHNGLDGSGHQLVRNLPGRDAEREGQRQGPTGHSHQRQKPNPPPYRPAVSTERPPHGTSRPPGSLGTTPAGTDRPPVSGERSPIGSGKPTVAERPPLSGNRPPLHAERPPASFGKSSVAERPQATGSRPPVRADKPSVSSGISAAAERPPGSREATDNDIAMVDSERSQVRSQRPADNSGRPAVREIKPPSNYPSDDQYHAQRSRHQVSNSNVPDSSCSLNDPAHPLRPHQHGNSAGVSTSAGSAFRSDDRPVSGQNYRGGERDKKSLAGGATPSSQPYLPHTRDQSHFPNSWQKDNTLVKPASNYPQSPSTESPTSAHNYPANSSNSRGMAGTVVASMHPNIPGHRPNPAVTGTSGNLPHTLQSPASPGILKDSGTSRMPAGVPASHSHPEPDARSVSSRSGDISTRERTDTAVRASEALLGGVTAAGASPSHGRNPLLFLTLEGQLEDDDIYV